MTFYSGKVVRHPDMGNPTLLIITDRNDLDDQLFGTFAGCKDLLRQSPVQAGNRSHLKELLKVASGGIVFTTIQKFMPDERGDVHTLLSNRNNIVVIADEAHRSQYDFINGLQGTCMMPCRMPRLLVSLLRLLRVTTEAPRLFLVTTLINTIFSVLLRMEQQFQYTMKAVLPELS